jgi:hypothetical protein
LSLVAFAARKTRRYALPVLSLGLSDLFWRDFDSAGLLQSVWFIFLAGLINRALA